MSTNSLSTVDDQFMQHSADFRQEWLNDVMQAWNRHYPGLVGENDLRHHAGRLLDELVIVFAAQLGGTPPDAASERALAAAAREFRDRHARAGLNPAETAKHTLAMNNVLTARLLSELSQSSSDWGECLERVECMLEHAPLLTFETYQQSLMLTELYTPIIRLWGQLLMLPLVGVIDSHREHQVAECLRQAIIRYKAKVTLIDVTGVPAFDTDAVHHIMNTVDLAQGLGTRVVITGVSAAAVQTLIQAGSVFASVATSANLRGGIAEASQMIRFKTSVAESVGDY